MNSSVKIIVGVVTAATISGVILAYLMGPFKEKLGTITPESYLPQNGIYQDIHAVEALKEREPPVIKARNGSILEGQVIDMTDLLESITDADGIDLRHQVKIRGESLERGTMTFSSGSPGIYYFICSVTDSHGLMASKRITILVNGQKGNGGTA